MAEALYSVPTGATGASASSNPARQSIDDGQQSGSHGTLMLGKRGRSKYLGPTAGSEWLKEASHRSGRKSEQNELTHTSQRPKTHRIVH